MVGAGVVIGQAAFGSFAIVERISGCRSSSDYDSLDLYRILEVVEGSEDWKLLYPSDYESHVSFKHTLRNTTNRDVLAYEGQIRPTFLDAEGFAVREIHGSGRVVPAGGEPASTEVVQKANELADQIADLRVLGP